MEKVEIVFAEFGGKFEPNVPNIRQFFPDAEINIFRDKDVESPFDIRSAYWGNYMNDYWKVRKLLESKADIAISFDADIKIVSDKVKAIIPLVKKFGLCLPANPRKLVAIDTLIGSHSDKVLDETEGMGYAFNMTPIALYLGNTNAVETLRKYCLLMEQNPVRGPLAMWRAVYHTGAFPCLLPPQWCVCGEDAGIGDEIILHIGHQKVREHYATII